LGDKVLNIDEIVFENTNNESECSKRKQFENLEKKEINLKVEQNGAKWNDCEFHNYPKLIASARQILKEQNTCKQYLEQMDK
jgi:hypothetical protein